MSDLERELESELHRVLDAVAARPIPTRRSAPGRVSLRALLGGAGAALTIKVLTGVAVAAAAVTVAGAATTGSLNPAVWGQQVSDRVQECKDRIANSNNVSIAEVGALDEHRRCILGMAMVSNDSRYVEGALSKLVDFVRMVPQVSLIDYQIELL